MPLIRCNGLTVRYAGRIILHDIHLAIERGEIATVVGPNGAGKSTLLRAMIGSIRASEGRVERMSGLRIGYVPQRLRLDSTLPLTVRRFLRLGAGGEPEEIDKVAAETGISDLEGRAMSALSGGQFQRVLLARALLAQPDLLVLDEPAQGLDQPSVVGLYRLLERIRSRLGCGILVVSHDLHVVMGSADRVIGLNGIIWCDGPPITVSSTFEYQALFGELKEGVLALSPYTMQGERPTHAR